MTLSKKVRPLVFGVHTDALGRLEAGPWCDARLPQKVGIGGSTLRTHGMSVRQLYLPPSPSFQA